MYKLHENVKEKEKIQKETNLLPSIHSTWYNKLGLTYYLIAWSNIKCV